MKKKDRYDLAVVALHPIQYQAGLWRAIAQHPRFELHVLYLDSIGVDGSVDPTMKAPMKWDLPLLEGYHAEFLRNLSPARFTPIVHRINPGLLRSLRARPYDGVVVHGYLTLSNWIAMLTARLAGTKIIYRGEGSLRGRTLHDGFAVNLVKHPTHAFYLRHCDAIACSSEDNRDYHLKRGAPEDRLFLMPCAVDNDALEVFRREAGPTGEFRKRHGLPETARLVISVGRFFENKCTADCISAFATSGLRDRSDVHLLLVGDGPEREALEQQARESGLGDRIHLLGFLNQREVTEALLASDVFILASNRDPSPKALSEALYLGLPIVCSDGVGTCPELVKPDENGFIFSCRDFRALADNVGRVLDDAALRKQMGKRSHEIAGRNDFKVGIDSLAQKLDELMEAAP